MLAIECFLIRISHPTRSGFTDSYSVTLRSKVITSLNRVRDLVNDSPEENYDPFNFHLALDRSSRANALLRIRTLLRGLPSRDMTGLAPLYECRHGLNYVMDRLAYIIDSFLSLNSGPFCVHSRLCAWIQYLLWYMSWLINLVGGDVVDFEVCEPVFALVGKALLRMRAHLMLLSGITSYCWNLEATVIHHDHDL